MFDDWIIADTNVSATFVDFVSLMLFVVLVRIKMLKTLFDMSAGWSQVDNCESLLNEPQIQYDTDFFLTH